MIRKAAGCIIYSVYGIYIYMYSMFISTTCRGYSKLGSILIKINQTNTKRKQKNKDKCVKFINNNDDKIATVN